MFPGDWADVISPLFFGADGTGVNWRFKDNKDSWTT